MYHLQVPLGKVEVENFQGGGGGVEIFSGGVENFSGGVEIFFFGGGGGVEKL